MGYCWVYGLLASSSVVHFVGGALGDLGCQQSVSLCESYWGIVGLGWGGMGLQVSPRLAGFMQTRCLLLWKQ